MLPFFPKSWHESAGVRDSDSASDSVRVRVRVSVRVSASVSVRDSDSASDSASVSDGASASVSAGDSDSASASVSASTSDTAGASVSEAAFVSGRVTQTLPRLAYEVFGQQGPPVLFVMGFGMPGAVWGPQVDELQKDHRCCHYDHLGVGDSDRGPFLRTVPAMAEDAVRILDDLSWDRAHIVGVSMGGMIAQELALRSRDRCRSVTLVATHGGAPVASLPTAKGMWLFVRGLFGGRNTRMKTLPRLLYPDEFVQSMGSDLRKHLEVRLGHPPALRTVLGQLHAVWRHSTESRLSQIETPTLLVRPGKDILIRPTQTDRLAARIPNARVLRFDDAGHGVTFQKAAELNDALRDHFAGQDTDALDVAQPVHRPA